MKLRVVLKPCPWYKKTPDLWMPIGEETWLWQVECKNAECLMMPKTPFVAIRNTSKTIFSRFAEKVKTLETKWNQGNDYKAYEAKEIDLTKIENNFTF